jgi:hypothetical protein
LIDDRHLAPLAKLAALDVQIGRTQLAKIDWKQVK